MRTLRRLVLVTPVALTSMAPVAGYAFFSSPYEDVKLKVSEVDHERDQADLR
jgi:hypothetical protein